MTGIIETAFDPALSLRRLEGPVVAPLPHRTVEIHVPNNWSSSVSGKADPMKGKNIAVRARIRKLQQPERQGATHAACKWHDAPCSAIRFRPRNYHFTFRDSAINPP